MAWLNGLPAVRAVLAGQFDGRAITKQNLSEWRKGGFSAWNIRQEFHTGVREFSAGAGEPREAPKRNLTEDLATVLSVFYRRPRR